MIILLKGCTTNCFEYHYSADCVVHTRFSVIIIFDTQYTDPKPVDVITVFLFSDSIKSYSLYMKTRHFTGSCPLILVGV